MHRYLSSMWLMLTVITIILMPGSSIAQGIGNPPAQQIAGFESFMTSREMWLSLFILIFGLAIIGVQYALLRGVVDRHISEIFKLFTVSLIIIGTLLLISAGFNSEQIAPALGLFGTIAGYILARSADELSRRTGGSAPGEKEDK
jgi:hypothetical protein